MQAGPPSEQFAKTLGVQFDLPQDFAKKDGSHDDLYLLQTHETGQILDVSLVRFQTERHNLRDVQT